MKHNKKNNNHRERREQEEFVLSEAGELKNGHRPKRRDETGRGVYFNREINWLEFNWRVFEEAQDETNPLLERIKFLSIFNSNQDEFFMIRVSGLKEQVDSGLTEAGEDGYTPWEQLVMIRDRVMAQDRIANELLRNTLIPELAAAGIHVCDYDQLDDPQKEWLHAYFEREVYPVLTPLAFDPGHPFPHISNLSLSLAVVLRDGQEGEHFARVKIPGLLPRLVPVNPPDEEDDDEGSQERTFVWLEQLVAANLALLFPGVDVVGSYPFRLIRDADLEIREDEAGDLLQTIQASLNRRRFGEVVNLSVSITMPENIRTLLMNNLELRPHDVYIAEGPMGQSDLIQLYDLDRSKLKDPPFRARVAPPLRNHSSIFRVIRSQDVLLHHPYDSFTPIVDFIQQAATDPEVLAIKQTIYRVGSNSPIVEALVRAALNGKQVSVLVELKARFDEENNIEWARALERAGAHVVYGRIELKTHCKVALVVRREADGIRRYVHLGTGNYNVKTAQIYTDLGLLTCNPDFGSDATLLFNSLTGLSVQPPYRKLLVSPGGIRRGILDKIEREIKHAQEGRSGHLIFKVNSLVDFDSIDALYRASQAGVKVDLIVRGYCSLVPGLPGLSENIRVVSIVGRFLEHSRIYYFRNGGDQAEIYLGSADLMQRNLDRRVETLFPLENPELKRYVADVILPAYLKDNVKSRQLLPDGSYQRVQPVDGQAPFSSQDFLLAQPAEVAEPVTPVPHPVPALVSSQEVQAPS